MRVDLRVKHDVEARKAAIGLFELGHGYKSAAIALSLPAEAVRRWQEIYRAFGSEVLCYRQWKIGQLRYCKLPNGVTPVYPTSTTPSQPSYGSLLLSVGTSLSL